MSTSAMKQLEYGGIAAPYATGNEWALVQQAITGDASAFDLLVSPVLGRLERIALAMLRNREDAEDVLQDGLCKAYLRLRSFQGRSSFSTWLTRIVINSALMTLRRQKRRKNHMECSLDEMRNDEQGWFAHSAVDERPNPEKICAVVELGALIKQQIMKLPVSERNTFLLYVIHGRSVKESSLTLGIPAATLKSRISRTRRKLARGLQHSLGRAYASSNEENTAHAA